MLNKDQYNQDEYNDYYAQATESAEIKYGGEEGGSKKMIIILLLLMLIGGLAYFVWKTLGSSETTKTETKVATTVEVPSTTKTTVKTPIKESPKEETSVEKTITPSKEEKAAQKMVQSITSAQAGSKNQMSPEDMAKIVQMVTQQMKQQSQQQEKQTAPQPSSTDNLQASLENAEVDTLSTETIPTEKINNNDSKKQASANEKPNTYNKVLVAEGNKNASDDLSKLSDEISNVINAEEESTTDATGYTQSLKSEVETRVKEMRYVTVKKGDTLGKIAKRIYGNVMDYKKIYEANPDILRRADRIYIGQRLRVPE